MAPQVVDGVRERTTFVKMPGWVLASYYIYYKIQEPYRFATVVSRVTARDEKKLVDYIAALEHKSKIAQWSKRLGIFSNVFFEGLIYRS